MFTSLQLIAPCVPVQKCRNKKQT